MRAAPGVADAAYGSLPLWWADHNPIFLDPSRRHPVLHAYEFQGSQHLSSTLGLHIVEGHGFNEAELPDAMAVYMGKATARCRRC